MSRTKGGYYADAESTRASCQHCGGAFDAEGRCEMCGRTPEDSPEADAR